jgi:hypothetical protein
MGAKSFPGAEAMNIPKTENTEAAHAPPYITYP